MRSYFIILLLSLTVFSFSFVQAQTPSLTIFSELTFDLKLWDLYQYQQIDQEFQKRGITSNPGFTNDEYVKGILCETCDYNSIQQVYFQSFVLQKQSASKGGVLVAQFGSVEQLQQAIPHLAITDEEFFLQKNEYLIFIWNQEEDEDIRNELLHLAVSFYQQKGAQLLQVKEKELTISEEDFEKLIQENQSNEDGNIAFSANKKVKHIFVSEGAFIAFYDDGTVAVCPDCELNRKNLEEISADLPFSIYLESKSGVMIQSKDRDVDEPILIDFKISPDLGKWMLLDFQVLEPIPQ